METLKKYVIIQSRRTNGGTTDCFEVRFNEEQAFADGAIKNRPLTPTPVCANFEQQPDGTFICDDDNFTVFETKAAAELFSIARTLTTQAMN